MKRVFAVIAAIGIALGGYVHFRLWHGVYHLAPIREMFLINVVVSAFLAVAVLIPGRRIYPLAGAALSAGSLAAISLSRTVGLPTPHGRWTEIGLAPGGQTLFGISDTLLIIVAEMVALIACSALAVVAMRAGRADRAESPAVRPSRRRGAPVPQWAVPA